MANDAAPVAGLMEELKVRIDHDIEEVNELVVEESGTAGLQAKYAALDAKHKKILLSLSEREATDAFLSAYADYLKKTAIEGVTETSPRIFRDKHNNASNGGDFVSVMKMVTKANKDNDASYAGITANLERIYPGCDKRDILAVDKLLSQRKEAGNLKAHKGHPKDTTLALENLRAFIVTRKAELPPEMVGIALQVIEEAKDYMIVKKAADARMVALRFRNNPSIGPEPEEFGYVHVSGIKKQSFVFPGETPQPVHPSNTEDYLSTKFSEEFGSIVSVLLIPNEHGQFTGSAQVVFFDPDDANKAVQQGELIMDDIPSWTVTIKKWDFATADEPILPTGEQRKNDARWQIERKKRYK